MNHFYQTKRVEFASGEEVYFVVDKEARYPLEYPALYVAKKLRKKGRAASTIQKAMECVSILYSWARSEDIELEDRLSAKEYLTEEELDRLVDFCLLNFKVKDNEKVTRITAAQVVAPESSRQTSKIKTIRTVDVPSVEADTQYNRITMIAPYLMWLSIHLSGNEAFSRRPDIKAMVDDLKDYRPGRSRKKDTFNPKSLTRDELKTLYEYVTPESDKNPFKAKKRNDIKKVKSIQVRNELIFILLDKLGVRRGELCGIKLKDLHLAGNSGRVDIFRRPEDKADTRKKRAQVKTEARELPIDSKVAKKINEYVTRHRSKVKGAIKSEFLFITHEKSGTPEGSPLSLDAVDMIFTKLSEASGIKVTPHCMRHTWNDEFSRKADKEGWDIEREKALRRYLMGWSENSKMPDHYAKRHIRETANAALLEMQNKSTKGQSL